ncbi:hypothetical protein AYI68_g2824 [Smittium mucronatum]|uniref:Uncharacterized protein n=1 Tax=Smittium mucronatum TaxID=133383 RepID=A0A1R0H1P8_9FUNG|nr:hypothetical protein AYI68_g2824 [Smittium mucronatum]
MADEHQGLINRFNACKAENERRLNAEKSRLDLLGSSQGPRNRRDNTHADFDPNLSLERSEIEIDGFIGTGMAALDNLKQQRAFLNVPLSITITITPPPVPLSPIFSLSFSLFSYLFLALFPIFLEFKSQHY